MLIERTILWFYGFFLLMSLFYEQPVPLLIGP